jgi:hypothetical protein
MNKTAGVSTDNLPDAGLRRYRSARKFAKAVKLMKRIREELGSNPDQHTRYPEVYVDFVNPLHARAAIIGLSNQALGSLCKRRKKNLEKGESLDKCLGRVIERKEETLDDCDKSDLLLTD